MYNILGWLVPFKKQLAIAAFLIVTHGAVYMIAQANQRASTALASKTVALEGVKEHARTEREVIQLADPDLDSRLLKWMRD
jgi:hypothetical protein